MESKRTLKNQFPSRLAEFDTPLKPPRITDRWSIIPAQLANKIPVSGDHRDFLKKTKSPASSFMFKPVTAREVKLEILALPNNKSYGLLKKMEIWPTLEQNQAWTNPFAKTSTSLNFFELFFFT